MAVKRDFYSLDIKWNPQDAEPVDISTYVTRIVISKTLRALTPIILLDFDPTVRGILREKINAYGTIDIKIDKWVSEGTGSGASPGGGGSGKSTWLEFTVFPVEFDFVLHRERDEVDTDLEERSPMNLMCFPTFFNKVTTNVCELYENMTLQDIVKDLLGKVFKNAEGLDDIAEFDYNPKFRKLLVHKTTLIDYLRYLFQRFGIYKSGPIIFWDFPKDSGSEVKIVVTSLEKAMEKQKDSDVLNFIFKPSEETTEFKENEFPIYKAVNEQDNGPTTIMRINSDVNYLVWDRDTLFKHFKYNIIDVMKEAKTGGMDPGILEKGTFPEHLDNEKPLMTTTFLDPAGTTEGKQECSRGFMAGDQLSANKGKKEKETGMEDKYLAHRTYFCDRINDLRKIPFRMDFFFPIDELATPAAATLEAPGSTLFEERIGGKYLIVETTFEFVRLVGQTDVWKAVPDFGLSRR